VASDRSLALAAQGLASFVVPLLFFALLVFCSIRFGWVVSLVMWSLSVFMWLPAASFLILTLRGYPSFDLDDGVFMTQNKLDAALREAGGWKQIKHDSWKAIVTCSAHMSRAVFLAISAALMGVSLVSSDKIDSVTWWAMCALATDAAMTGSYSAYVVCNCCCRSVSVAPADMARHPVEVASVYGAVVLVVDAVTLAFVMYTFVMSDHGWAWVAVIIFAWLDP
jgi:hypothetical protein